jgi:DNA polymerase III delta prime subunit
MDWKIVYDKIVENARDRILEEKESYELHHVLPRSLGGVNNKSNLVALTLREHFFCHVLLCKIYENDHYKRKKMLWAFHIMSMFKRYTNSRQYSKLRQDFYSSYVNPNKGKKLSTEMKLKISKSLVGKNVGRKHTEEYKKKMSLHFSGKITSEETKMKISRAMKGRFKEPRSESVKLKMKEGWANRSEEQKSKTSDRIKSMNKINRRFSIWRLDDPEKVYEFDSFAEADRAFRIGNIDKILRGQIKQSKGWTAKWKDLV